MAENNFEVDAGIQLAIPMATLSKTWICGR
jgi:hypothetical protein